MEQEVLYVGFAAFGRLEKVCKSVEEAYEYEERLKSMGFVLTKSMILTENFDDVRLERAYEVTLPKGNELH